MFLRFGRRDAARGVCALVFISIVLLAGTPYSHRTWIDRFVDKHRFHLATIVAILVLDRLVELLLPRVNNSASHTHVARGLLIFLRELELRKT
eukprot:COSAG05_NODE_9234_length_637_cov_1.973978_1_plen_93_part_00